MVILDIPGFNLVISMFAESILRLKNGAKIYDLYIDNKNILWEI